MSTLYYRDESGKLAPLPIPKGKDGITPHIGASGNWFYGDIDTGLPSVGATGSQGPRGDSGVYILSESETVDDVPEGVNVIIDPNGVAIPGLGISTKEAKIGQTIKITELDDKGLPAKWEPTDFPSIETIPITILAADWSSSVPYMQTISVEGITPEDNPKVYPLYSDELETAIAQRDAWSMVSRGKSETDAITFICFEDKPTVDIPIQIEVNR